MDKEQSFQNAFQQLKNILAFYEDKAEVQHSNDSSYYLNSPQKDEKGRLVFFGAVAIKKNYVSYHLMPVYVFPSLLSSISEDLKKHMQGKSCFNFKNGKSELFKELEILTRAGYEKYQQEGMM